VASQARDLAPASSSLRPPEHAHNPGKELKPPRHAVAHEPGGSRNNSILPCDAVRNHREKPE
jgi:hypothetical protein